MPSRGKRYTAVAATRSAEELLPVEAAVAYVKSAATAKFDESIEACYLLGIDPKKSDQNVRGTLTLPHGTGRTVRIAVVAEGEGAEAAREAGADEVGGQDLVEKIDGGWSDFDVLCATPDMMRTVARLGKKLGPRMPNAKSGTVSPDIGGVVRDLKRGQIEYRANRGGVVQSIVGKASFADEHLAENFRALTDALVRSKPAAAKGLYLKSITLSSTMGPSVRVDSQSAAGRRG